MVVWNTYTDPSAWWSIELGYNQGNDGVSPRSYSGNNEPGACPINDISIEFEIRSKFGLLSSWRVQNVVVIGSAHFKSEHCKFGSNFEFDRNIVSGTGARAVMVLFNKPSTEVSRGHVEVKTHPHEPCDQGLGCWTNNTWPARRYPHYNT